VNAKAKDDQRDKGGRRGETQVLNEGPLDTRMSIEDLMRLTSFPGALAIGEHMVG
jgi:hypothetical protein